MVDQGTSIVERRDPQIRRAPNASGLYDVLDLILDKGIVIDAFVRVSLVGIELLTIDARVVVASVDTYLRYAEGVERLQVYNRAGSTRLPDLVGKTQKGKAIGRGVEKVTEALTGRRRKGEDDEQGGDEGGDAEHEDAEHEHGGLAETVTRGVRGTVGKLVHSLKGEDSDSDGGEGEEAAERDHGRRDRQKSHRSDGAGRHRSKSGSRR
jgi:hypothetical protein